MRTTTTVLAVGATALALPATAHADDPAATAHTSRAQMHAARERDVARDRTSRVLRRAHRLARLRHERFSARAYRRRLRDDTPARLHDHLRTLRSRIDHARRPAPASPTLQAIAACESGGNPAADTGNGFYGKYQFTLSTWQSVGGTGNPAAASEAEQDRRAAMLYAREGASPWPVCGR